MLRLVFESLVEDAKPQFPAKFQQRFSNEVGVFSLTEVPNSTVMWAHYADRCRGIAYEFDTDDAFFSPVSSLPVAAGLVPIRYADLRPQVTLLDFDFGEEALSSRLLAMAFFTKSSEWSYEKEWRLVRPLEQASEVLENQYYFQLPSTALSAVILGPRSGAELGSVVRDSLQLDPAWAHVRLFNAVIHPQRYEIEIVSA